MKRARNLFSRRNCKYVYQHMPVLDGLQLKQAGVTLLEVMLALSIGAMIVFLSIRQYQTYRFDTDIRALQRNVDTLFQSLAYFYRANCQSNDPKTPFASDAPSQSFSVDIQDLKSKGYLTSKLDISPFVQYSGSDPLTGYVLQFNEYQLDNGNLPTRQVPSLSTTGQLMPVGSITIWQAQVSVRLKSKSPGAFQAALEADCLSNMGMNNTVTPCAAAPKGATQYAAFTRAPSFATTLGQSPLWMSMPTLKQFTQMYTTDPINILMDPNEAIDQTNKQYYVCAN